MAVFSILRKKSVLKNTGQAFIKFNLDDILAKSNFYDSHGLLRAPRSHNPPTIRTLAGPLPHFVLMLGRPKCVFLHRASTVSETVLLAGESYINKKLHFALLSLICPRYANSSSRMSHFCDKETVPASRFCYLQYAETKALHKKPSLRHSQNSFNPKAYG